MKGIEPLTPSLPWKCSTAELHRLISQPLSRYFRAGEETRTLDPQLGRLMLYQLSYARVFNLFNANRVPLAFKCFFAHPLSHTLRIVGVIGLEPIQSETPDLQSGPALQLRRTPSLLCVRLTKNRQLSQ